MPISRHPLDVSGYSLFQVIGAAPSMTYDENDDITDIQETDANGRPLYKVEVLIQVISDRGIQSEIVKIKCASKGGLDPAEFVGQPVVFTGLMVSKWNKKRNNVIQDSVFSFYADTIQAAE